MENKIIIAGGGHAGIEAAMAIAKMGYKAIVVTLNKAAIGRMSCNPAIGGLAKGHIVKEIDALGGIMGYVTDQTTLQNKILNKSKGRAVWAPRSQIDKIQYTNIIQALINKNKNIQIIEDEVIDFTVKYHKLTSVILKNASPIKCACLIITCGTFMEGLMHIGNETFKGGRMGEKRSMGLTQALKNKGFELGRLKTGTPPRAHKQTIDFSILEKAIGEKEAMPFSMFTARPYVPKNIPCYLAYTTKKTHKIINNNIHLSAMFSGKISGVGPRYCPSIEDKIIRFADKSQHQLFLEPEWEGSQQIYINGFSTSLPASAQIAALKTIKGLEKIELIRPGYAIEYDYVPSYQLKASLETKKIQGLFCAGQINGTSGYEEAAAQGLMAGINAAHYIKKNKPIILKRSEAYIGVLIDDLITKHINEPYRMFTSRAENRLLLRAETAGFRLCPIAIKNNMLTKKESAVFYKKVEQYNALLKEIKKIKLIYNNKTKNLYEILKQPKAFISNIEGQKTHNLLKKYSSDTIYAVETAIKYSGYEVREAERNKKIKKLDSLKIPLQTNYYSIKNLSIEAQEKLSIVKPETLGQASRIGGVRSSDIAVISLILTSK